MNNNTSHHSWKDGLDCDGYMALDWRGGHTCMKCGEMQEIAYYTPDVAYDSEAYK